MTVTGPVHVTTATALRHAYQHPQPAASDEDPMSRDLVRRRPRLRAGGVEPAMTAKTNAATGSLK